MLNFGSIVRLFARSLFAAQSVKGRTKKNGLPRNAENFELRKMMTIAAIAMHPAYVPPVADAQPTSLHIAAPSTPTSTQLLVKMDVGPSANTAVANQKSIVLVGFDMRSTDIAPVTSITIGGMQGNLSSASNYTLRVDTNGDGMADTILQQGGIPQNGTVTLSHLLGGGYAVPSGVVVHFEVDADVVASPPSPSLQVDLIGVTAKNISPQISHVPATLWHLTPQGNLFVTASTTPISSHQYLLGTVGTIGRLDFRAENEDEAITMIHIGIPGVEARSIKWLQLRVPGASNYFTAATIAGTGTYQGQPITYFDARMRNNLLVARKGSITTVIVDELSNIDANGGVNGAQVKMVFEGDPTANAVSATGLTSGHSISQNNGDTVSNGEVFIGTSMAGPNRDIVGNLQTLVGAQVTSVSNANPDANGTTVPVGIRSIGQFKFNAAANANSLHGLDMVALNGLHFDVNYTNVSFDPSGFYLMNKSDTSSKVAPTSVTTTATGYHLIFTNLMGSVVDTRIGSGQSIALVLQARVLNPNTSSQPSSLQVSCNTNWITWLDMDQAGTMAFIGLSLLDPTIWSTLYVS